MPMLCVAAADVCGAGSCVYFRRCVAAAADVYGAGGCVPQRRRGCGNGWRVAVRCCVCQRQMCTVPVLCYDSGAVLRCRRLCVVPVRCCGNGWRVRQLRCVAVDAPCCGAAVLSLRYFV